MSGLGAPADTMRESDVIVLMVSPLLALRLVTDHNTEQGPECRGFCHDERAWIGWKCPIEQAPPSPYGESMQATYSRGTTERIVGDSQPPPVDVSRPFSVAAGGAGGRPCIRIPRRKALLRSHFSYFLCHNSDFGRSGRRVPRGRTRFCSSPNTG